MPIYRDVNTGVIAEYPENIGNHPILGASLELYVPRAESEPEPVVEDEAKRHFSLFNKPDKDAE